MSPIAEALQDLAVDVDALTPHPKNPRKGDVGAIKASLERFGQVRPIVSLPDGTIVAGHHVFYAARDLGWDKIAVVQPDLSPEEAEAYLIADNRLNELGGYDDAAMAQLLQDMMENGDLSGTGYTPDAVDDLLARIGAEIVTDAEEFKGGYIETPEETHEKWNSDNGREKGTPMREVVLMYKAEDFEQFATRVAALKKAWGADATAPTLLRAVTECAEREGAVEAEA